MLNYMRNCAVMSSVCHAAGMSVAPVAIGSLPERPALVMLPDDRLQAGAQRKSKSRLQSFTMLWLAGQKSRVDRDFWASTDGFQR